ncbi:MAG: hypothetical protein JXR22_03745 [Prolixibacteraceae bacterium]|nr:hypothetical protein [Prolixibacteraceae bacterium]
MNANLNIQNKVVSGHSPSGGTGGGQKLIGSLLLTAKMIRYNLKIIFGNRFIYFLISAIALSIFIVGVNLFNGESMGETGVFRILLLSGALLLFYPLSFGIQSDKDARTMEIIFGIPDYRYRVWLMRVLLIYGVTIVFLLLLSELLRYTFVTFSVLEMLYQVLYPLAFLGLLTFFLSTVLRSGNATAAVIILLGIVLLMLSEEIASRFWNIFFNPYDIPSNTSEAAWQSIAGKNKLFLGSGSIIFLLGGLMNLQNREKLLGS